MEAFKVVDEAGPALITRSGAFPCLGVGVLGVCVGLAGAGRPSIWYDEAATLSAIRRPPDEILQLASHQDAVHALYYLSAWAWSRALGDGILPVRALSAVGLGAMACLVVLLADRLLSRRAAVWAGVVAALIPGLSWSGLEGRSYAWAAALAVLATYVLVLARDKGGAVRWTAYALVVTLLIWWSFFAGLMLLVHGVALIIADRRVVRPWMVASAAATLACLPLVGLARAQSGQISWIQQPPMQVVSNVALRQVLMGQGHNTPGVALHEMAAVGLGLVVAVSIIGWLRIGDRSSDPLAVPLVLVWATAPTLIVAGANLLGVQIYQSRYLTFSTPAIAIAVGAGLAAIRPRPRVALAVVGCLLMTPILLAQRSEDAKAGDDYLRLARLARDAHTDLVVFDRADLRGIKIAYPDMFRGIHDASLAQPPRHAQSLWGRNLNPWQLRRHQLAGKTIVLYQLSKPAPVRFNRALRRLGCERSPVRAHTARSDAVVLQC